MKPLKILAIAPYTILPANSGGRLAIVTLHEYLGRICEDHIAGTVSNASGQGHHFHLHRIFPDSKLRYRPGFATREMADIIRAEGISCIICEHPYMAFSAISLSQKLGIPWFMRSHNIESERFRSLGKPWWPAMRWFERYAMQKATGVFFITPEDRRWAIQHYGLNDRQSHLALYGTPLHKAPERDTATRQQLAATLGIPADVPWLYFLGALDYQPNAAAVACIIRGLLPRLRQNGSAFRIIIAGKGLDTALQQEIAQTDGLITYAGFVPDLHDFLNACDIMINPVLTGGGIKTKAVEALGYNKMLVTTESGAAGIMPEVCGPNMLRVPDNDLDAFARAIATAASATPAIPDSFYQRYYWGNIAREVAAILQDHIKG